MLLTILFISRIALNFLLSVFHVIFNLIIVFVCLIVVVNCYNVSFSFLNVHVFCKGPNWNRIFFLEWAFLFQYVHGGGGGMRLKNKSYSKEGKRGVMWSRITCWSTFTAPSCPSVDWHGIGQNIFLAIYFMCVSFLLLERGFSLIDIMTELDQSS